MRHSYLLNAICLLFLISACTSNKELAKKSVFSFSLDENQFQIISVNTKSGEGTNYLARVNIYGKQLSLARDLNQDGSIDLILRGELSINEADVIYNIGIEKAKEMGNYAERVSLRTFEYLEGTTTFTIKTYLIGEKSANNLFLILDNELQMESIFLDTNADGVLDAVEKGTMSLSEASEYYKKALELGLEKNKIELRDKSFWVKEANILDSATALK